MSLNILIFVLVSACAMCTPWLHIRLIDFYMRQLTIKPYGFLGDSLIAFVASPLILPIYCIIIVTEPLWTHL